MSSLGGTWKELYHGPRSDPTRFTDLDAQQHFCKPDHNLVIAAVRSAVCKVRADGHKWSRLRHLGTAREPVQEGSRTVQFAHGPRVKRENPMDAAAARASTHATVVFQDGLGERRQIVDQATNEILEMLCLRAELTAVPSFEFALRERVSRLANFRHAYYGRVRRVDRLSEQGSTLGIVSEVTPGARLSEILAVAERRRLVLDINAALCLIRQLVPAVAMLHQNARDVAHGALGPERIVVTPHARLVIVDYVLGAALEQLHYSHERYWKDFRIALPRSAGLPRFDHRGDVTQLGIVALSLILGRPLKEAEYPAGISDVVASATAMSALGGREPITPRLRTWLSRTLQIDLRNSYTSAIEVQSALEELLSEDSGYMDAPVALETFLARYHECADRAANPRPVQESPDPRPGKEPAHPRATQEWSHPQLVPNLAYADYLNELIGPAEPPRLKPPLPTKAEPRPAHVSEQRSSQAELRPVQPAVSPDSYMSVSPSPVELAPMADSVGHAADPIVTKPRPAEVRQPEPTRESFSAPGPLTAPVRLEESDGDQEADDAPPRNWRRAAAVAGVLMALAGGGLFAARYFNAPTVIGGSVGTLVIESNPAGAQVMVDGESRGVTPLSLTLKAGAHVVELRGAGEPRVIPLTVPAGSQVSQYIELPSGTVKPMLGQLQIRTEPAGARVTLDGQPRGTAPLTVFELPPGDHEVLLESDLGSIRQQVTIEAGITASLVVPMTTPANAPLSGWVSVSTPVEVQLFEGGRLLGTSQSDRIMVAAGRHDILMVNDTLGYTETRTVQVAPGRVAPISLELPKGTVALNAIPWAEVWIDGERVGDTPIGNLPISIGPHEVIFRNPDLGEERHAITVTTAGPARLSVDLRKK